VIETDPKAGTSVKEGKEITLKVSKGISKIKIEDYTGENYIKIETQLELKGLKVNIEKSDSATNVSDDESQNIVGQSIDPGKEVEKGTEITLYIPNIVKYYPDMVSEGWTLGEARTWSNENNIKLTVKYEETNKYDEGVVIKQSKSPNDILSSGGKLTVTISKAKKEDTSSKNNNQTNNKNNNQSNNNNNQNNTTQPEEQKDNE